MCLVVLAACGNVSKQKPDAAVVADAPVDTFDCTGHAPDGSFTFSPMMPGLNDPTTFTATAPGLSYAWTFPSGNPGASAALAPVVSWTAAGQYKVGLTVSDSNHCMATTSQMVDVVSCAQPIAGPTFDQMTGGHANAGIAIVPSRNTTLTSFTVMNQSMADTINLTDSVGNILQTLAIPAGTPTYQAVVSWPLVAGTTYHLVTQLPSNGRWTSAPPYPVAGSSLAVTAGWMDNASQTAYWFSFLNLVTCP